MDPCRPPKADLDYHAVETRSVWWKVYFLVILVLTAVTSFWELVEWNLAWYDYVGTATMLIALLGVFGFAFCKRIASPRFWRAYFYVLLLTDIVLTYVGFVDGSSESIPLDAVFFDAVSVALLLYLPIYFALYMYGSQSRIPWTESGATLDQ
ncbi:hypothetical protein [Thiosocius teredinicola]|uniref:hypothetical protein n=1 Tax=Thiosocius teredinicola TaxID=1973002 RepID=UPI00099104E2